MYQVCVYVCVCMHACMYAYLYALLYGTRVVGGSWNLYRYICMRRNVSASPLLLLCCSFCRQISPPPEYKEPFRFVSSCLCLPPLTGEYNESSIGFTVVGNFYSTKGRQGIDYHFMFIPRGSVGFEQASQRSLGFFSHHELVLLVDFIPLGLERVQELGALLLSQLLQAIIGIADLRSTWGLW